MTQVAVQPAAARQAAPIHGRLALLVSVHMGGQLVEERFLPAGVEAVLGAGGDADGAQTVALPVPEGLPYIARVTWPGWPRVREAWVRDGVGVDHPLRLGEGLEVDLDSVVVRLEITERFALRRTEAWATRGSLALLATIFLITLTTQQAEWGFEERCNITQALGPLLGEANELRLLSTLGCIAEEQPGGIAGGAFTAEYLQRLLQKDLSGSDEGVIELQKRAEHKRPAVSFYMPAGADGPKDKMEGAKETAPEPVRSPEKLAKPLKAKKPEEQKLLAPNGTPIEDTPALPAAPDDEDNTGVADADEGDHDEAHDPRAERQEGWGIPDWYNETDKAMEEIETSVAQNVAKEQLRIDPNDREALSVLSYYQYLAEDYDAAAITYDKYIQLFPDESAGYNNKALIYKRRGDYPYEERLYRVALALHPGDVTALNNLAVNLAHQKRFDEALQIMVDLEELDPGEPYADLHRAKIYAELGDDESALRFLEASLQGMAKLDTLHHIEFRQDIRLDPSFERLRKDARFHAILVKYYGVDSPFRQ